MVPMQHIEKQGCLPGYATYVIVHLRRSRNLNITNQNLTRIDYLNDLILYFWAN